MTILFLFDNIVYADSPKRDSTDNLSPTSRFNPIVIVSERDGKLSVTEDPEERKKLVDGAREDAAFLYLNMIVAQFLRDAVRLSGLGMSDDGICVRLENLKRAIGRDLPHVDFDRFNYLDMYYEDRSVLMPYIGKSDGRKSLFRYALYDEKPIEPFEGMLIPLSGGAQVILRIEDDPVSRALDIFDGINSWNMGLDAESAKVLSRLRAEGFIIGEVTEEMIRKALKDLCDIADTLEFSPPGPGSEEIGITLDGAGAPSLEEISRKKAGLLYILVGRNNEVVGTDYSGDVWVTCADQSHSVLFQANLRNGTFKVLSKGEKSNPKTALLAAERLVRNIKDRSNVEKPARMVSVDGDSDDVAFQKLKAIEELANITDPELLSGTVIPYLDELSSNTAEDTAVRQEAARMAKMLRVRLDFIRKGIIAPKRDESKPPKAEPQRSAEGTAAYYKIMAIEQLGYITDQELLRTTIVPYLEDLARAEGEDLAVKQAALRMSEILTRRITPKTEEAPPKGSPATLLRYMHENNIFKNNPKSSQELSGNRGGNDSRRSINRELRVLQDIGLVQKAGAKYYLVEWLDRVNVAKFIEENPTLNKASPSSEDVTALIESVRAITPAKTSDDTEELSDQKVARFMVIIEFQTPSSYPKKDSPEEVLMRISLEKLRIFLKEPLLSWEEVRELVQRANKEWEKLDSRRRLLIDERNKSIQIAFVNNRAMKEEDIDDKYREFGKLLGTIIDDYKKSGADITVFMPNMDLLGKGAFWQSKEADVASYLNEAGVAPGETMLDAGSGTGTLLCFLCHVYKMRGVGIEIVPQYCDFANFMINKLVDMGYLEKGQVTILNKDFTDEDFSKYSLVYYFSLGTHDTSTLLSKISSLREGARLAVYGTYTNEIDKKLEAVRSFSGRSLGVTELLPHGDMRMYTKRPMAALPDAPVKKRPITRESQIEARDIDRGPYIERRVMMRANPNLTIADGISKCLFDARLLAGEDGKIVKHTVFVGTEKDDGVASATATADEGTISFFGPQAPTASVIAEPPFGTSVEYECTIIVPKGKDARVEYREMNGIRYAVILEDGLKWVYAAGIKGDASADIPTQSTTAFETLETILRAEGMSFGDILRQWNYIPRIVNLSTDGKRQHYQMFNDVRGTYYARSSFPAGYPAATGIGSSAGSVTIDFIALQQGVREGVVVKGITNLLQTDPHAYAREKLVGEALDGKAIPETPKFERGKVVAIKRGDRWDARIYISGTASIRGPDTISIGDAAGQTNVTLENIEYLISEANIMSDKANLGLLGLDIAVGAKLDDLVESRTYVKFTPDAPAVKSTIGDRLSSHHMVWADVCRPNLLMETEGEAIAHVTSRVNSTVAASAESIPVNTLPTGISANTNNQRETMAVKYFVYNSPYEEATVFTVRAQPGSVVNLQLLAEGGNNRYVQRTYSMTQITTTGIYAVCVPRWASPEEGSVSIVNPGHRYNFTFDVTNEDGGHYTTAGMYEKASAFDSSISDLSVASVTIPELIESDQRGKIPSCDKKFATTGHPDELKSFLQYVFSRNRVVSEIDKRNENLGEDRLRDEIELAEKSQESLIAGQIDRWLRRKAAQNSEVLYQRTALYSKKDHERIPGARAVARLSLTDGISLKWGTDSTLNPVPSSVQALVDTVVQRRVDWRMDEGFEYDHATLSEEVMNASINFAINEILTNAFDAFARAGSQGPVSFRILRDAKNGKIIIDISDDGVGINTVVDKPGMFTIYPNRSPRGYEPWLEGGRGIGLMWSRIVVELHGGTLEALKNEYDGYKTTIRMTLPESSIRMKMLKTDTSAASKIVVDEKILTEKVPLDIRSLFPEGTRAYFATLSDQRVLMVENTSSSIREGSISIPWDMLEKYWPEAYGAFTSIDIPEENRGNFIIEDVSGRKFKFIKGANINREGNLLSLYFKLGPGQSHTFTLNTTRAGIDSTRPWNIPGIDMNISLPDKRNAFIEETFFVESLDLKVAADVQSMLVKSEQGERFLIVKNITDKQDGKTARVSVHIPLDLMPDIRHDIDGGNFLLVDPFAVGKSRNVYIGDKQGYAKIEGNTLKLPVQLRPGESAHYILSPKKKVETVQPGSDTTASSQDEKKIYTDVIEREKGIATTFRDTAIDTADRATKSGQKVLVALGTGWIKGYGIGGIQHNCLNPLIVAMKKYCEAKGMIFVYGDDATLAGKIEEVRIAEPKAKVVVLAGEAAIMSQDFKALRDDMSVFLAGVDNSELNENSYVRIIEMLTIVLRLAFHDTVSQQAHPDIVIKTDDRSGNICILVPKAQAMDARRLEEFRDMLYQLQKSA